MTHQILTCQFCGAKFRWSEKDERDYVEDEATGDILEGDDPKKTCPGCRVKSDQQRS